MRYRKHSIRTTTRVDAGDKSMHDVLDTNEVSENILNKMSRRANEIEQERANEKALAQEPVKSAQAKNGTRTKQLLLSFDGQIRPRNSE